MEQIVVKSQQELDAVPTDYNGRIVIEFGTPYNRAVVNRKFKYSVELWGNSSAMLRGNSSAMLRENSSAVLMENSSAMLRENSSAVLWENSSAVLWGNSRAVLWGNSSAVLWGNSSAVLMENSSAVLMENSSAVLWGNSRAVLWGNSRAVLWGNSSAVLMENSSAMLWENSSAEAKHNSQVNDKTKTHKVSVSGNARVVYDPQNIKEYIDTYELENDGKTVRLFKAVHKRNGEYMADWTTFEYVIGEVAEADSLDEDVNEDCGHGIHMAYKEWCLSYGASWPDLAILELEAEIDGVIVPLGGAGKVRAAKAKVIREVPLKECGLYGKMLARRMK